MYRDAEKTSKANICLYSNTFLKLSNNIKINNMYKVSIWVHYYITITFILIITIDRLHNN